MATVSTNDPLAGSWHRWFRRTNVYIAEYIIMLILVASFIGVLVSLWFSFFGLVNGANTLMVYTAAGQIGSLLVLGPAAFWLYARVTGQEMVQPELYERKSRTVFLAIWLIFAVLALVGMVAAIVASFVNAMFGLGGDFGTTLVISVLPGLFAVATVAFGLFMVVKHTSRKFVMVSAIVLVALAFILLVANLTMVLVRKDDATRAPSINVPSTTFPQTSDDDCSFSDYLDKECTYSEYLEDSRSSSSTTPRTVDPNDY